jgi:MFS family permease
MSFSTLPSPLYSLYRVRDHLSALMITVIYGIFAVSTTLTLLVVQPIAARIGRRGVMVSVVVTMMAAAGVLARGRPSRD